MFGVASAAGRLITGAGHVTADDDFVIEQLRRIRSVIPANINNDTGVIGDGRTPFKHLFVKDYFDPSLPSRSRIDNGVLNLARTLKSPF